VYIFVAFIGSFDARCYARQVFSELFGALGVDLHVFGHFDVFKRCREGRKLKDVRAEMATLIPSTSQPYQAVPVRDRTLESYISECALRVYRPLQDTLQTKANLNPLTL
jgi:hypothetical protein